MGQVLRKTDAHYTSGEYRQWPPQERWELIEGTAWNMSPAPSRAHQAVLGRLNLAFGQWLGGTVVQPDLSVFCHPERLTDAGARGAPDVVVEVLSPWTSKKDLNDKFSLYERHGVREYWVVDPAGSVQVYRLNGTGRYDDPEIVVKTGSVASAVLEGLQVDVAGLFAL